jgi:hypothetical protein
LSIWFFFLSNTDLVNKSQSKQEWQKTSFLSNPFFHSRKLMLFIQCLVS